VYCRSVSSQHAQLFDVEAREYDEVWAFMSPRAAMQVAREGDRDDAVDGGGPVVLPVPAPTSSSSVVSKSRTTGARTGWSAGRRVTSDLA